MVSVPLPPPPHTHRGVYSQHTFPFPSVSSPGFSQSSLDGLFIGLPPIDIIVSPLFASRITAGVRGNLKIQGKRIIINFHMGRVTADVSTRQNKSSEQNAACPFDGDICTTAQAPHVAEERPSGKQLLCNQSITLLLWLQQ